MEKAYRVCLEFEPMTAGWKANTNPLALYSCLVVICLKWRGLKLLYCGCHAKQKVERKIECRMQSLTSPASSVNRRLDCFLNNWPFTIMKVYPIAKGFESVRQKCSPMLNKPFQSCQRAVKFCQSVKIPANPVTLLVGRKEGLIWKWCIACFQMRPSHLFKRCCKAWTAGLKTENFFII